MTCSCCLLPSERGPCNADGPLSARRPIGVEPIDRLQKATVPNIAVTGSNLIDPIPVAENLSGHVGLTNVCRLAVGVDQGKEGIKRVHGAGR